MKILLAVHHYPPHRTAGAELLAHRTAQWLNKHGHTVRVVTVQDPAHPSPSDQLCVTEEIYKGVSVQRLSFNGHQSPDSLGRSFDNPLVNGHIENLMRTDPPDLFHLISGYLIGGGAIRAAKRWSVPTIVTLTDFWFACPSFQFLRADHSLCTQPSPDECLHCLFVTDRQSRVPRELVPWVTRPVVRALSAIRPLGEHFDLSARLAALKRRTPFLIEMLNASDAIVALTDFVARLHVANGVNAQRIWVIPDCVDLNEFDLPVPMPRDSSVVEFGYLGQIVSIKGVDLAIRAFRKLNRTRQRARLTIYGKLEQDPAYTRSLRELAGDDSSIVFAGGYEHRRLLQVLNGLDVVVVPSIWYENAPRVIWESFVATKPVIGTNLGGISEIVQHEVNGLLFERNNVVDLGAQMQRVLDEPGLIQKLSKRIPRVRTLDEGMSDLLAVYEHVLQARQSASVMR